MERLVVGLLSVVALLAAGAPSAAASCVNPDARVTLERGEAAFVGTLADRTGNALRFTVERTLKGSLGSEVVVRDENPRSSIGLDPPPGERIGLVLGSRDGAFYASACDQVQPDELEVAAASAPPCATGEPVQQRPIGGEREAGIRPLSRAYILGCVDPARGHRLELVAYRQSRLRGGGLLCIDYVDLLHRSSSGCGTNRRRGRAPAWVQGSGRDGGRIELRGPAIPAVRSVRLHYTLNGRRSRRAAAFLRVTAPALLRRLRIQEPFGQFVAEVPRGARDVRLTTHGEGGRPLGRVLIPGGFRVP